MSDDSHPWPRRIPIRIASEHIGATETKFRTCISPGKWPRGIADGGNVYRHHEDLDRHLDALKTGSEAQSNADPAWQRPAA